KGVQHESHTSGGGVMTCGGSRLAVDRDFFRDFVEGLAEQMSEHVCAELARLAIGVRVACSGDPERQFGLNRTGQRLNGNLLTARIAERNFFAAPQAPDLVDLFQQDLLVVGVVLGTEDEIVKLPSGSE